MCPNTHRWFPECSEFDGIQEDHDIVNAENSSLSQIEKETESQPNTYRPNRSISVCDQGIVMKRMPDYKDCNDSNNAIQPCDNANGKNDRAIPAKVWDGWMAKKNKLNKLNDMFNKKATLYSFGFDHRHEKTRQRKTTLPVAAINHLHKPSVTGGQLKPSNVSRRTDIQISLGPKELKTALNGEQESIYPDDSDDLYSNENLESEPESSGTDDSPSVYSTDKDDATSDGEDSTVSDYEFEVMKLFSWLDEKDWARSYYDCDDGVVIHVEPGKVEASQRLLAEEFPDFQKYSVVETEPGVCTYSADPFEEDEEKSKETNNNQTPDTQNAAITEEDQTAKANGIEGEINGLATGGYEQKHAEVSSTTPAKSQPVRLQPGDTITSDEHRARFSGRVGSKGLTVAHIGPSDNIYHCSNERQHLIGTMEKVLEVDVSVTHLGNSIKSKRTADLGLLNLTGNCRVTNTICYEGIYRLKLYKGRIKKGTLLRIIDQYGAEKHGELTNDRFNLKRKEQDSSLVDQKVDDCSRGVFNMLRIQNEDRAISTEGDSGTLVTSIPEEGSNEVFVYGIVTHHHKEGKCEQPSATIANRLSDILGAIDEMPGKNVGLRHQKSNDIDFTEDED